MGHLRYVCRIQEEHSQRKAPITPYLSEEGDAAGEEEPPQVLLQGVVVLLQEPCRAVRHLRIKNKKTGRGWVGRCHYTQGHGT